MNLSNDEKDVMRLRTLRDIQANRNYTESNIEFYVKFFDEYLKETSKLLKLLGANDQKFKELLVDTKVYELNKGHIVYSAGSNLLNIYAVFKGIQRTQNRQGEEGRRQQHTEATRRQQRSHLQHPARCLC